MLSEKDTFGNRASDDLILQEMTEALKKNLLNKWYPLVLDKVNGGYFTNVSYDWEIDSEQYKMIVTQARHIWTTSKAALLFNNTVYETAAKHGFYFLKNYLWDKNFGGFYQMRNFKGGFTDYLGFNEEKRTYGNAFGIFGLAAFYDLTKDENVLNFIKEVFGWIESHAYDPKYGGYFQFLTPEGIPFNKDSEYKSQAYDIPELGYKDQNSSIHLLEAYTELYAVWKDPELKSQLMNLLILIRDVITTPKGYMNLFFQNDWNPVSFRNDVKEERENNYRLEHVSFGHDYETAFLLLEASYILDLTDDYKTLSIAKKMVDHALFNGWDAENGGFFDAGYYFQDEDNCTIIQSTKNWWAQAEGLNTLLIMSKIFPDNQTYSEYFVKQWEYIKKYLLDNEHGGWFEGGLDKEPQFNTGHKGHIWKCTYHTARALMNCIKILSLNKRDSLIYGESFIQQSKEYNNFIHHWKNINKTV